MNMLERLLAHDLAATQDILNLCLDLSEDDMDREFDVGWQSLRRTLHHMIGNIEVWTDLMMERSIRPSSNQVSASELLLRLNQAYTEFAEFALKIEQEGRLDDLWTDVLDNPPAQKSFGGAIGHVITHNMHHRAELQHIMHRLGMSHVPEGDLMGWDQQNRLS